MRIVCTTSSVFGSMRDTVPPSVLATHTAPLPTAMLPGWPGTGMRSVTDADASSTRSTSWFWGSATQSDPSARHHGGRRSRQPDRRSHRVRPAADRDQARLAGRRRGGDVVLRDDLERDPGDRGRGEHREQDGQPAPATAAARRHNPRRPDGRCDRLLVAQDLCLQLAHARAELEAEFGEAAPGGLAGVERVRLPAGAVEGEHQLEQQSLVQRMVGERPLDLSDQRRALAHIEAGGEELLEGRHAAAVELLRLAVGERLAPEVGQSRPAPQRERVAEPGRRGGGVGVVPGVCEQPLEPVAVELARLEDERVSRGSPRDPVRAQGAAKTRQIAVERLLAGGRRALAPQPSYQRVA